MIKNESYYEKWLSFFYLERVHDYMDLYISKCVRLNSVKLFV
jgi:hypothetical protein